MGKAKYILLALRHIDKLPKKRKKIIGIVLASLVLLLVIFVGLLIALIIWVANTLSSPDAMQQTIDKTKHLSAQQ